MPKRTQVVANAHLRKYSDIVTLSASKYPVNGRLAIFVEKERVLGR